MLTDTAIKRLQPRASPYRVFDGGDVSGFGAQITPAGSKSWFIRYRHGGKTRYLTLGHYPHTGVAAARQRAREALALLDAGIDPASPQKPAFGSLGALLAAWTARQRDAGRRRVDDVEQKIRANCAGLFDRPANSLAPSDFCKVLERCHRRGARTLANRLRAYLHAMYRYGIQHDHDPRAMSRAVLFGIETNPLAAIPRDPGAERVGERVLSWAEVRELWRTERITWETRQAFRLLLAFGCRVNEICQARWDEFDLDAGLWALPAGRSKNRREHLLPIPALARELLIELRALHHGDWLFPARNCNRSTAPWGVSALSRTVKRAGYGWMPRDLRRTWKTLTGECGIDKSIRDRVQNHALSDVGSRHYDRFAYLPEKRAALDRWCHELSARVAGDNVIPLSGLSRKSAK